MLIERQMDMFSILANFAPSVSIHFVAELAFATVFSFQTVVFSILVLHGMGNAIVITRFVFGDVGTRTSNSEMG
jgi:hypothetical protein